MNFSDLLNIFELLLTLIVGFYLAHWYNVRDTQSRSIKDYYIERLNEFKKEIDSFFQDLLKGKCSSKQVTEWYEVLENRLIGFDDGLCQALPIRKKGLTDIVFMAHSNLSLLEEFNEQFNEEYVLFGTNSKYKIKEYKRELDKNINQYLTLINHSSYNNIFLKLWYNIKNDWNYYRDVKHQCFPIVPILWNLLRVYFLQLLCILCILLGVDYIIGRYEEEHRKEEMNLIIQKQEEERISQHLKCIENDVNEIKSVIVESDPSHNVMK